jgi:hypothetical protein
MSHERAMIDTVKHQYDKDLQGTCLAYERLSTQVTNDEKTQSSHLPADAAKLAIYDIAFAKFNLGFDYDSAAILCQDAQKRIDTAAERGFNVRNLQKEENKLKSHLPPFQVTGG